MNFPAELPKAMTNLFPTLCLFLLTTCAIAQPTPPASATYPASFTVAQDGSGNFKTIQEAVNAFRDHSQVRVMLYIKTGVYAEKLIIPSWKPNIHLIGESKEGVIITGDDFSGKPVPDGKDAMGRDKFSTYTTYTVLVDAPDIILENLTIRNTAGRVGQAVALHVEGDRFMCQNCRLLGNQDTLFAAAEGSRQYYVNCFVEGTTDFIFGKATAIFQSCTIKSLSDSYITAAATPDYQGYGFVFFDCLLIADAAATKVFLGRPWRPHAKTVFIRTNMGSHIVPAGWDNWRDPNNEKTALYAEYASSGPGSNSAQRVGWSKQFTPNQVQYYTVAAIFSGAAGWLPPARLQPTGGRDTSFTVQKSFLQEKKRYPDITLADSTLPAGVSVQKNISYSTPVSGRNLLLDVYTPPTGLTKKYPAVLMIHGGGWRSGDRSHNNTMAGQLAASGFVTIPTEYRLSTEALYPVAVHDIKAAVRWVRANATTYAIDTNRIAVLGFSAGGQLAALLGSTNQNPAFEGAGGCASHSSAVQAVVDIDGILAFIHPESGEGDDSRSTSAATYWFGHSKTERPNLWRDASALTHADRTMPPILFINSSVARMHAGRDDLIATLNQLGIYSEVHTFPDAPHTFLFFNPWFAPTLTYVRDFLNRAFVFKK